MLTCDNSMRIFAKIANSPDTTMKYAAKHKTPRQGDVQSEQMQDISGLSFLFMIGLRNITVNFAAD